MRVLFLVCLFNSFVANANAEVSKCPDCSRGSVGQYTHKALIGICDAMAKDPNVKGLLKESKVKSKLKELSKLKRIVEFSKFGRERMVSNYIYLKKIEAIKAELNSHQKSKEYLEKYEHLEIWRYCLNTNLL